MRKAPSKPSAGGYRCQASGREDGCRRGWGAGGRGARGTLPSGSFLEGGHRSCKRAGGHGGFGGPQTRPPLPSSPALTPILPGQPAHQENTGPEAGSDPRGGRSHLTFLATAQGAIWATIQTPPTDFLLAREGMLPYLRNLVSTKGPPTSNHRQVEQIQPHREYSAGPLQCQPPAQPCSW